MSGSSLFDHDHYYYYYYTYNQSNLQLATQDAETNYILWRALVFVVAIATFFVFVCMRFMQADDQKDGANRHAQTPPVKRGSVLKTDYFSVARSMPLRHPHSKASKHVDDNPDAVVVTAVPCLQTGMVPAADVWRPKHDQSWWERRDYGNSLLI